MSQALLYNFFVSPDSYLLRNALSRQIDACKSENEEWDIRIFWADEGLTESFWEHLILQGLFSNPKLIVLRQVQALPADTQKELSAALNRMPYSVRVLLCLEVPFERGAPKIPAHTLKLPCFIHAQKHKAVTTIAALTPSTIAQFVQTEAKRLHLRITPLQSTRLASMLPPDAALIASEMEKLALTASPEGSLSDDALSMIEQTSDTTIFDMLRKVQSGTRSLDIWRKIMEDHLSGDTFIFAFLAVLTREARTLWQLLAGETPAMPPQAIPSKRVIAQTLGYAGIAKIWELALDADRCIKTGEKSPEQSFELLLADLFLLFQRSPHAPHR